MIAESARVSVDRGAPTIGGLLTEIRILLCHVFEAEALSRSVSDTY
jgi:hypothetical protein